MHDELEAAGATLVAISPQLRKYNRRITGRHKLSFDVLADPGNAVAKEYGLKWRLPEDLQQVYLRFPLDLPKYNGDDSWTLPVPARFVVATDGRIVAADADPDYTVRPEPSATLEVLRGLGS